MTTYEEAVAALHETEERTRFELDTTMGLRQVYRVFPLLVVCESNNLALERFCAPGPVDLNQVTWGLKPGNSNLLNVLAFYTDQEARETFVNRIVELTGGSAANQEYTRKQMLATFGAGFNVKSTEELAAIARNKEAGAALRAKKPYQLRGDLSSTDASVVGEALANANAQRQAGLAVLPAEFTPQVLKRMEKEPLRKLIRQYTAQVVTNRLQGKS